MLPLLIILLTTVSCCGDAQPVDYYRAQREKMVKQQIEARGITDKRVLAAMRKVERHLFVDPLQQGEAYADHPLPIGYGQTISQPYIVAFMSAALKTTPETRVLEIGTGSGYQAAVLAELCDSVFTVEIIAPLGEKARNLLRVLGYTNVRVKIGDGYQGWKEHAPYHTIMVTCSPSHVPQPLIEQLAEGGRMIIPVDSHGYQQLVVLVKKQGHLSRQSVLPVRFVPMINAENREY
ncbi:MAG: protein-L-isoaspartate(D-aspartate) O-methyltransferase [Bacteroidales bacterium]|nr:protein-L-isoaspartate(D-aspartate) O-methyltransferase [Bacteroidales bacterium]